MTEETEFIATGQCAVAFQTWGTEITVGVDARGNETGIVGRCDESIGIHGIAGVEGGSIPNRNAAVLGNNHGFGYGVWGKTKSRFGLWGVTSGFGEQSASAIWGQNFGLGHGIKGTTETKLGGPSNPKNILTAGVYGLNSGEGYGVVGESEKGDGVFGRSLSKSGVGVHGSALADDGKALGDGIKGEGIRGVYGIGRMGVEGESENDYGVVGESKIGYGAEFIGGRAQLLLKPNIGDKPPGTDLNKHKTGEIYVYQSNEHSDAELWFCTFGGQPGRWRRIA